MFYFLSFYFKTVLILFLNILSSTLIPNGTNVSGRSVILISILSSLLQKIKESRNQREMHLFYVNFLPSVIFNVYFFPISLLQHRNFLVIRVNFLRVKMALFLRMKIVHSRFYEGYVILVERAMKIISNKNSYFLTKVYQFREITSSVIEIEDF